MFGSNGWKELSDEKNFIVASINGADDDGGFGRSWNGGGCSSSPLEVGGHTCTKKAEWDRPSYCMDSCGQSCHRCDWCTCLDDVGLTMHILNHLKKQLLIDEKRIYAHGYSNGAIFTYELALRKSHVFAAIAPLAGSVHKGYYETVKQENM